MTTVLDDLTALTLDELAPLAGHDDDSIRAAAIAEIDRRDVQSRRRGTRRMTDTAWAEAAHAQYLEAERVCRGHLLSRRGQAAGITEWSLWSGPEHVARACASEELRAFWDAHPRLTVTAYRDALAADRRDEHETAATVAGKDKDMGIVGYAARTVVEGAIREGLRGGSAPRQPTVQERYQRNLDAMRAAKADKVADRALSAMNWPKAPQEVAVRDSAAVAAPAGRTLKAGQIDGARVLNQCYGYLSHMVYWPSDWAAITATLTAAAYHAKDEETGLPAWLMYLHRLFFTSHEGGSGKTAAARQTSALCPMPMRLTEMTKAAYIGLVAKHHTVVVTELDRFVGTGKRNQWLTGLANVGYEFDGVTSRKANGQELEIPLFGPLILDGLDTVIHNTGTELRTLMTRCIIIRMERAPEGYRAPRYDPEKRAIAKALSGRLQRWMAQEVREGIAHRVPVLPDGLGNRPADLWEPLFAVADAAGGDWPALAREACRRIETDAGTADKDLADADRIDAALDGWGASVPSPPAVDDDGWGQED